MVIITKQAIEDIGTFYGNTAIKYPNTWDSAMVQKYINETLDPEIDALILSLQGTDTSLTNALTTAQSTLAQAVSDITSIQGTLSGLKSGATTKITIGNSIPGSLENGEIYLQYF